MNKEEFEKSLYEGERLNINPETYLDERVKALRQTMGFGDPERQSKNRVRAEEALTQFSDAEAKGLPWLTRFNNIVPKNWSVWFALDRDMQVARQLAVQLNPEIVDAGISHPHWGIRRSTALSQQLDSEQLGALYIQMLPGMDFVDVENYQLYRMGSSDGISIIHEARSIRHRYINDLMHQTDYQRLNDRFVQEYLVQGSHDFGFMLPIRGLAESFEMRNRQR